MHHRRHSLRWVNEVVNEVGRWREKSATFYKCKRHTLYVKRACRCFGKWRQNNTSAAEILTEQQLFMTLPSQLLTLVIKLLAVQGVVDPIRAVRCILVLFLITYEIWWMVGRLLNFLTTKMLTLYEREKRAITPTKICQKKKKLRPSWMQNDIGHVVIILAYHANCESVVYMSYMCIYVLWSKVRAVWDYCIG